jgi:two-component system LytT family sensor kinase
MIFEKYIQQGNMRVFFVSHKVIWASAIFMGILASVPKILQLKVSLTEVIVDCIIAFVYSLYVWFYNLYTLPKFSNQVLTTRFFGFRLLKSLAWGLLIMGVLVIVNQIAFEDKLIGSMVFMYQFRGILINLTIYMFLYLLYQSYINQVIGIELERTKADHLTAKYELLKQQVNPHFLFNSLNTLKSMVDFGDEHSSDFIVKLSDFYRYSLESREKDAVCMDQELKILEAYYFLIRSRFEDGISIKINLTPVHHKALVPAFTLQLLVENAVKHNIISIDQPLHIEIISEGDRILVRNNLQLKNVPEPSTKIGLENINQRYMHLAGKTITVDSKYNFFTVALPVHEYISH